MMIRLKSVIDPTHPRPVLPKDLVMFDEDDLGQCQRLRHLL